MKLAKSTNQKKINQKNKKSRSLTMQIHKKHRSVKIQTPEPEELRSENDTSTPQGLVSVAGHPKNCLHIDSSVYVYILFN